MRQQSRQQSQFSGSGRTEQLRVLACRVAPSANLRPAASRLAGLFAERAADAERPARSVQMQGMRCSDDEAAVAVGCASFSTAELEVMLKRVEAGCSDIGVRR